MTRLVGLLRAVNVGGTGKLPMTDLRAICADCGFSEIETYIASGNVVFGHAGSAALAGQLLETALASYAGKPVGVIIRTAAQMAQVVRDCPFADALGNKAVVLFLPEPPPPDALADVSGVDGEEIAFGRRELYVHYVNGQGRSKLAIPAAKRGTARNMNTVRKLCAMAGGKGD